MVRFLTLTVLLKLALAGSCLYAKFEPTDADEVDRQEDISLEFYNDIISYRPPAYLEDKWSSSPIGFRINAGSLDAKEFSYLQESKFFFTLMNHTASRSNKKS